MKGRLIERGGGIKEKKAGRTKVRKGEKNAPKREEHKSKGGKHDQMKEREKGKTWLKKRKTGGDMKRKERR